MKILTILQARMSSTRLPGKVMKPILGQPMMARQIERLRRARRIGELVVATSVEPGDDVVADCAASLGCRVFRGSLADVLARYAGALEAHGPADHVVRVTADCPLIDPAETDRVVRLLCQNPSRYDYAANIVERTLPRGLDTEALFVDTLLRVDRLASSAPAREHVTYLVLRERPDLFAIGSVTAERDDSDLRWTVDEAADLALVRRLYEDLALAEHPLARREIAAYVRAHPEITEMNARVQQRG